MQRLPRGQARQRLADLCRTNALALEAALEYCAGHGIGAFRVNSGILPLRTHPAVGYRLHDLPDGPAIVEQFQRIRRLARQHQLRLTFHPDQFVVLSSPHRGVVDSSIEELEYQAEVSDWIGGDVLTLHVGGAYGDKTAALATFRRSLDRLSDQVRRRLAVENDDKLFTPQDLLPLCRAESLPLVYDVHHHRCVPDGMTMEDATLACLETWNREPVFHISSPLEGWRGRHPARHHDYISLRDFPALWERLQVTVEVEAKAKELAVRRLRRGLEARARRR